MAKRFRCRFPGLLRRGACPSNTDFWVRMVASSMAKCTTLFTIFRQVKTRVPGDRYGMTTLNSSGGPARRRATRIVAMMAVALLHSNAADCSAQLFGGSRQLGQPLKLGNKVVPSPQLPTRAGYKATSDSCAATDGEETLWARTVSSVAVSLVRNRVPQWASIAIRRWRPPRTRPKCSD